MTVLELLWNRRFDFPRNMKKVRIIRARTGDAQFHGNLKGVVNGTGIDVFYLQPSYIVYVPSKLSGSDPPQEIRRTV